MRKNRTSKLEKTPANTIINLALKSGRYTFYLDQFDKPTVVDIDNPFIGYPIQSKRFKQEISRLCWMKYDKVVHPSTLDSVISALEGICTHTSKKTFLHNRVAKIENNIYYDIGDNCHVVVVNDQGWEIKEEGPVLFKRFSHQECQVLPKRGGNLNDVLKFFNLKDKSQEILLLTYLPVCIMSDISRPLLLLHGSQGSGKSTALSFIRSLIDPSRIPLLAPPTTSEEFIRQADHNYCYFLDNISRMDDKTSDAFCRLVTGMAFSKRALFTDDDDVLYSFKRVTGFNGVAQFANKADLLDRSLILQLERIDAQRRKKEAELKDLFFKERPLILGGIFDAVSYLLKEGSNLTFEALPRMADYYQYAASAALFLNIDINQFELAFKNNLEEQHRESINASSVATIILEFMMDHPKWEGSSSHLFVRLKAMAEERGVSSSFPRNPNWLWRRIQEVKPELEAVGVQAEKDDSVRPRKILLSRLENYVEPLPVPSDDPFQDTEKSENYETESGVANAK